MLSRGLSHTRFGGRAIISVAECHLGAANPRTLLNTMAAASAQRREARPNSPKKHAPRGQTPEPTACAWQPKPLISEPREMSDRALRLEPSITTQSVSRQTREHDATPLHPEALRWYGCSWVAKRYSMTRSLQCNGSQAVFRNILMSKHIYSSHGPDHGHGLISNHQPQQSP